MIGCAECETAVRLPHLYRAGCLSCAARAIADVPIATIRAEAVRQVEAGIRDPLELARFRDCLHNYIERDAIRS